MEYKVIFGYLAVITGLIAYVPYFIHIFKNKTKPHAFSWLVWTILTSIAFVAQIVKHGGAGSWVTGVTSATCLAIFILALKKGDRKFMSFDWVALSVSFLAIFFWWLTKDPTIAVILVVITDAVGFMPTIRKSYYKPFEETASTFFLNSLKFVFALVALTSFSVATWLFPVYLIFANGLFALMLVIRRKAVQ